MALWRRAAARRAFAALALGGLGVAALALWQLHWQAIGLLAAGALVLVVGTLTRRIEKRRLLVAIPLAVVTLAATVPYLLFPIVILPEPDGPYAVGARDFELAGQTRRLPVTMWYPAAKGSDAALRPYLSRERALIEAGSTSSNWGFPWYLLLSLHAARSHALDAPAPATDARFPVVIFSHGYFSHRAQNTALMEQLASHGYIVVSVAHPRDGATVKLRDGTIVPTATDDGFGAPGSEESFARWDKATAAFMGGATQAERIAALPEYRVAVEGHRLGESIRTWRDDVLFLGRALEAAPPPELAPIVAQADFARTVHAGMSFGGSTAASACDADPHCVAAVDLDGENFDMMQFDRQIRAPLLLLLTEQPFNPSQRVDSRFNPSDYAWETWRCIGSREDVVRLRARGMLHMGLTDLVLGARGPFKREHFTSLDGDRALAMVNDTVLAFLDRHVRGGEAARFETALARYPELERLDTRSLRAHPAAAAPDASCPGGSEPKQEGTPR